MHKLKFTTHYKETSRSVGCALFPFYVLSGTIFDEERADSPMYWSTSLKDLCTALPILRTLPWWSWRQHFLFPFSVVTEVLTNLLFCTWWVFKITSKNKIIDLFQSLENNQINWVLVYLNTFMCFTFSILPSTYDVFFMYTLWGEHVPRHSKVYLKPLIWLW